METQKEINYYIMILNLIARVHNIGIRDVYAYIVKYKGMKFLTDFYDIEHTLNSDDVVDDVLAICHKNGGMLI